MIKHYDTKFRYTQCKSLTYNAAVACCSAEEDFLSTAVDAWEEGAGEVILLTLLYYTISVLFTNSNTQRVEKAHPLKDNVTGWQIR